MTKASPTQVSSVAVFNKDGALLFGLRTDNGKWTLPGGHAEDSESPSEAARRELEEETGIKGVELVSLGSEIVDGKVEVHAFVGHLHEGEADSAQDPDEECSEWRWVDVDDDQLPAEIADNLHSPKNVTLKLLDIDHSPDLVKHDTPEFQEWFAGSHVANSEGKPLKVYHGTSKDTDFSTFKIGKRGAWFSTDPKSASEYAKDNDSQGHEYVGGKFVPVNTASRVFPVHLAIKNPYHFTQDDFSSMNSAKGPNGYMRWQSDFFQRLRIKGHDGVSMGNGVYVAFHPHQIKSIFNQRPSAKNGHLLKMAFEVDQGHMRPHRPSEYDGGIDSVETYQVPADQLPKKGTQPTKVLYHHVVKKTPWNDNSDGVKRSVMHILSTDRSPFGSPLASSASQELTDGSVQHGETAAASPGYGYGTLLYGRMLRYHGKMKSDESVSTGANKVWDKVLAQPGVTGSKGAPNTPEAHSAKTSQLWHETPLASVKFNGLSAAELEQAVNDPSKKFIVDRSPNGGDWLRMIHDHAGRFQHAPNAAEAVESFRAFNDFMNGPSSLTKMALADVPVGSQLSSGANDLYDYSHLLAPRDRKLGVQLQVLNSRGQYDKGIVAKLIHPDHSRYQSAGGVSGNVQSGGVLRIGGSELLERFQGHGYGKAMYEALMAHAKNALGATHVVGGTHSTLASRVHASLAAKHGMEYKAQLHPDMEDVEPGDTDDRMEPYRYALKSEIQMKKSDDEPEEPKPPMPFRGHEPHELAKMDFTAPPPKLSKQFTFNPERFHYTEEPEVFTNFDHDGYEKTMMDSFKHEKNQAKFKKLHEGLCEAVGIHPKHGGGLSWVEASTDYTLGKNNLGMYDQPIAHIRKAHASAIMSHGATLDYDTGAGTAYEVLTHELLHGVSRVGFDYEPHDEPQRPHAALEESTTELLAQHYTNELERDHFNLSRGWRGGHRLNWLVDTLGGEAHLVRPISYSTYCQQFIRLVAKAEGLMNDSEDMYDEDPNGKSVLLHNAVVNHARLVKKSHSMHRLPHLIDRLLINSGFPVPAPGETLSSGWQDARDAAIYHLNNIRFLEKDLQSSHIADAVEKARYAYRG